MHEREGGEFFHCMIFLSFTVSYVFYGQEYVVLLGTKYSFRGSLNLISVN